MNKKNSGKKPAKQPFQPKAAHLDISSWRGISIGAIHYYGTLRYEIAGKYERIEATRQLSKKGAQQLNRERARMGVSDYDYQEGQEVNGFKTESEVRQAGIELFQKRLEPMGFTILLEGSSGVIEPQPILYTTNSRIGDLGKLVTITTHWMQHRNKLTMPDQDRIWRKWLPIAKRLGIVHPDMDEL